LLAAHKVRAFAELASLPAPADGGRTLSMMAGLVEEARWRTSAKGRRYMLATLSDATGQFVATAFDDEPSAALEAAAKASSCGLLTVELDRRPGEDAPRVTVKRFQPLDALAKRTRLQMTVRLADLASVAPISNLLGSARGGNGMLRLTVPISQDREATLLLGRDYTLDAELAARLERITGEGSVCLAVQEGPKLALVG
jgi:DNA polymerase-3 subunit alpha